MQPVVQVQNLLPSLLQRKLHMEKHIKADTLAKEGMEIQPIPFH